MDGASLLTGTSQVMFYFSGKDGKSFRDVRCSRNRMAVNGLLQMRMGQIFNDTALETEPSDLILTTVPELAEETRDGQFQ